MAAGDMHEEPLRMQHQPAASSGTSGVILGAATSLQAAARISGAPALLFSQCRHSINTSTAPYEWRGAECLHGAAGTPEALEALKRG